MFCFNLTTTLWLAAAFLLMVAGFSPAKPGLHLTPALESTVKVTTCDDSNNVQRLSCDTGVIGVLTALYGRTNRKTCSEGRPSTQLRNIHCSQHGTLDVLKKRCDGEKVCEISPKVFRTSDPCFGTYKYLETTYACFPAIRSVTCENSLAHLKCEEELVIYVCKADYGRGDRTTCTYEQPESQIQNVNCSMPATKVAESCNGKNSCTIRASSSVFGNPCEGTYKYLELDYICQESDRM